MSCFRKPWSLHTVTCLSYCSPMLQGLWALRPFRLVGPQMLPISRAIKTPAPSLLWCSLLWYQPRMPSTLLVAARAPRNSMPLYEMCIDSPFSVTSTSLILRVLMKWWSLMMTIRIVDCCAHGVICCRDVPVVFWALAKPASSVSVAQNPPQETRAQQSRQSQDVWVPQDPSHTSTYIPLQLWFYVTTAGVSVVPLNLLIAILGANYDIFVEMAEEMFMQARARIVIERKASLCFWLKNRMLPLWKQFEQWWYRHCRPHRQRDQHDADSDDQHPPRPPVAVIVLCRKPDNDLDMYGKDRSIRSRVELSASKSRDFYDLRLRLPSRNSFCFDQSFTVPRVQRGFSVNFFSWKTWNITQDLSSWSAQASLSQHSLAWHDFDPAFRSFGLAKSFFFQKRHGRGFRGSSKYRKLKYWKGGCFQDRGSRVFSVKKKTNNPFPKQRPSSTPKNSRDLGRDQSAPKYHTKGRSNWSVDSPRART